MVQKPRSVNILSKLSIILSFILNIFFLSCQLNHYLSSLGIHPTLCDWDLPVKKFKSQSVRIGNRISAQPALLQYWYWAVLCLQPYLRQPVHPWLCNLPPQQHHPEVSWQHRCGRSYHWWRRGSLQERGEQSGGMLCRQQPHPQYRQDHGDDCGHEEGGEMSSAMVYLKPWEVLRCGIITAIWLCPS